MRTLLGNPDGTEIPFEDQTSTSVTANGFHQHQNSPAQLQHHRQRCLQSFLGNPLTLPRLNWLFPNTAMPEKVNQTALLSAVCRWWKIKPGR